MDLKNPYNKKMALDGGLLVIFIIGGGLGWTLVMDTIIIFYWINFIVVMAVNMFPTQLLLEASEDIAAGSFVNLWDDGGTAKVRLADASNARQADGFCISAISTGGTGTVNWEGVNTALTGKTIGAIQFLGTAGATTEVAPSTSNHISQVLGKARSATAMNTEIQSPITLV